MNTISVQMAIPGPRSQQALQKQLAQESTAVSYPKRLPIGQDGAIAEVHGPADRMSSAYRRYLARTGVSLGVC